MEQDFVDANNFFDLNKGSKTNDKSGGVRKECWVDKSPPPYDFNNAAYCGTQEKLSQLERLYETEIKVSKSRWKFLMITLCLVLLCGLLCATVFISWFIWHNQQDPVLTTVAYETTPALPAWNNWSAWSECTASCDRGIQSRTRKCSGQPGSCDGTRKQQQPCAIWRCPNFEYGDWTSWSEWSECSLTCDTGTQSRSRVCEKRGDQLDCVGEAISARDCNDWDCPGCGFSCPNGGDMDAKCERCECSDQVTAVVRNTQNLPLDGVTISDKQWPGIELARTDNDGTFTVVDTCYSIELQFTKAGYVTKTTVASVSLTTVTMDKIDMLSILHQPENKERLVGENVKLCCSFSGNPIPDYVEWFKDGQLVSHAVGMENASLQLINISAADSGYYKCRASNDISAVMSHEAKLSVKDSTIDFCSSFPSSKVLNLPSGCQYANSDIVDIGECPLLSCGSNSTDLNSCVDQEKLCCGPKKFKMVYAECPSQNMNIPIYLVEECGCITCSTKTIMVSGLAKSVSMGTPLQYGEIIVNGKIVDRTNQHGAFFFQLPYNTKRLVITARDVYFNKLFETTKTKVISGDSVGYEYISIDMLPVGDVIEFDHRKDTVFNLGSGDMPFGQITIPKNSMYTLSGQRFIGNAFATINTIDPQNEDDIIRAPGELSSVDDEGRTKLLKTYGMFGIVIKDQKTNSELQIRDKVKLILNRKLFNKNSTALPKLWSLNSNTGMWNEEGFMEVQRVDSFFSHDKLLVNDDEVIVGDITISVDTRWTNFDGRSDEVCYSKVRVFTDNQFHVDSQIGQASITILVFDESLPNSDTVAVGASSIRAFTDKDDENGYCISHLCDLRDDSFKYKGVIIAEYIGSDENGVENVRRIYPGVGPSSGMDADTMDSIAYEAIEDAEYPGIRTDLAIQKLPDSTIGPFYNWDGYDKGIKDWAYSENCSSSRFEENHFRFYVQDVVNNSCKYEYTILETLIYPPPPNNTNMNFLAFYSTLPQEENFETCYLKALVRGGQHEVFRAYSFLGNLTDDITDENTTIKALSGLRDRCPAADIAAVCLEIKHSGELKNANPSYPIYRDDETFVSVSHENSESSLDCNVESVNNNFLFLSGHKIIAMDRKFEFYLEDVTHGERFGIYCAENQASKEAARKLAIQMCWSGDDAQFGEMPDKINNKNCLVEFQCGSTE